MDLFSHLFIFFPTEKTKNRAVARLQNKTRQVSSAEGACRKRRLGAYTPDNFEI